MAARWRASLPICGSGLRWRCTEHLARANSWSTAHTRLVYTWLGLGLGLGLGLVRVWVRVRVRVRVQVRVRVRVRSRVHLVLAGLGLERGRPPRGRLLRRALRGVLLSAEGGGEHRRVLLLA